MYVCSLVLGGVLSYLRTSAERSRSTNTIDHGGRAYPVRHYPVAIRLRDREGRAILCVALTPQSGYSSGTTLGVRSVALLHLIIPLLFLYRIFHNRFSIAQDK